MYIKQEKVEYLISKLKFKFPYSAKDWCENLYLENYHCHKDFSNCQTRADSPSSIKDYVIRVKELNGKCLYSLEHGFQGSWLGVYEEAENNDLKYRHSSEVYWVKNRHEEDKTNCHMCIIATNNEGKEDLNYILSIANEDGYYYKPRIDLDLLLSINPKNFIVTSACIAGWKYDDAEDIWLRIWKHFGNHFFLELQNHNTKQQKQLNKRILNLAQKYEIQIICGLDSHYIKSDDSFMRDQLLEYKGINYEDENGWYMDYPDTKEVIKRFEEQGVLTEDEILTAILNTNVFVNECEEIIINKNFKIPTIYPKLSMEEKIKVYKRELNKAYKKENVKSKEKKDGIRWEAQQIIDSNTVDYMLTSQAILKLGVEKYGGILTTTSRGSASSFCSNKLLGFTTMDRFTAGVPIYPERFLTKERVLSGQMPDIDSNIASQEPFVKAARELLGEYGCYPLMAVEVLKEKNAWKLYASNHNVDNETANIISKYIDKYNLALKHAEDDEKDLINIKDYIPEKYYDIYMQSRNYQGIVMNLKVHACGFLIFNGDIRREIGLVSAISESSGKRNIVACVEGKYLDTFGYVKEDFLVVDSVSLTHELFQSIGETVPSFEQLRNMVDGDELTWDIYTNGITCCVNQCEQPKTIQKVKKYKPQNILELAGFIAGIRPGFASLINTYINREPYSTGEEKIDKLLESSSHFLLYQELIMKVLSFLGLPMGETYGIIKSISKKKLKGEKKEHLLQELQDGWVKQFGNLDNFQNVWKVIEDSAAYAFNAPHAYAMAGDSLYQAWFKAHHTSNFYEVAISHYQKKNNKDKIDALIKEAMKFYNYTLGDYEFGIDNRKVTIDDENKIIYPNLSSVKGFGENTVSVLYETSRKDLKSFIDVINWLETHSVNQTIIEQLISINYFKRFGDPKKLLYIKKYYDLLHGRKQLSKEKIIENGLNIEFVSQYGNETTKQINKLDSKALLEAIVKNIPNYKQSNFERIKAQYKVLGIVTYINSEENKHHYFVTKLDVGKALTKVEVYEIYSGKTRNLKIWTRSFNYMPFEEEDFLYIKSLERKFKRIPSNEINPKTGKKIWIDDPSGEQEYWLDEYYILKEDKQ